MIKVQCPNCKKDVVWSPESQYRPFCSERCRLIDLGAWADGSYAVPTQESPEDSANEAANDGSKHQPNEE